MATQVPNSTTSKEAKVQPKPDFVTDGISGTRFIVLFYIFLAVAFGLGVYGTNLTAHSLEANVSNFAVDFVAHIAVWLVLMVTFTWIVFYQVLDTKLGEIPNKIREASNDSHALVLGGIMATSAVLVIMASGSSFQDYVFYIMLRGSLGLAVATALTFVGAYVLADLRSMDQFRDWITDTINNNNSHAIIISVLFTVITAIAMK